ncbi:MAG TPA: hypothetical protein VES88_01695, partial [Gemmatimonadaceae bacterium]|nr:hypothetical protein [Gemmatimonadaceae bacterium]
MWRRGLLEGDEVHNLFDTHMGSWRSRSGRPSGDDNTRGGQMWRLGNFARWIPFFAAVWVVAASCAWADQGPAAA